MTENPSEVRNPTYQTKDIESKTPSEAPRSPLKPLSGSQQYNLSSNQEKGLQEPGGLLRLPNFITIPSENGAWIRLSNLSEDEKIEIIKLGVSLLK